MDQFFDQAWDILKAIVLNLTNPDVWKDHLGHPQVFWPALAVLTVIVFAETGLLVGFFLPGDSLLVTAGLVGHLVGWPVQYLIPTLWLAAILGDSSGYLIGAKVGPRVFTREHSFFFRKKYLLAAQEFYERHGGKTIVLAKFVPIIRTFAPVVAGAARMPYRRFLAFSVVGAMSWITSMVLLGYTLHLWADAALRPILGPTFRIEKNIDLLVLFIVAVSVAPLAVKGVKQWRAKRKSSPRTPAEPPVAAA